jgi:hypothetical protein
MAGEALQMVSVHSSELTSVSIPFDHPDCIEKAGNQKNKVRGRYVSVERVEEIDADTVEWRMATSSDAGGELRL